MERKATFAVLAVIAVIAALCVLEWEDLSRAIWPERRLAGVWRVDGYTEGGVWLPHGAFSIFDFDLHHQQIMFSDGVCALPGPKFTFDGTVLTAAGDSPEDPPREFRVRFRGHDNLTIEDIGERGTLDLVRLDRDHLYPAE